MKKEESDKIEARKDINNNSQMSEVRKLALQNGIYSNPIKKSRKKMTEKQIIEAVSGGNMMQRVILLMWTHWKITLNFTRYWVLSIQRILNKWKGLRDMKDDFEEVNWSDYCYKENDGDKTWWVDTSWFAKGLMLITFNKKKFYNLFKDYPHNMSSEEVEIFDKENPFWRDFFSDRKS